jgi:hypothetical protein
MAKSRQPSVLAREQGYLDPSTYYKLISLVTFATSMGDGLGSDDSWPADCRSNPRRNDADVGGREPGINVSTQPVCLWRQPAAPDEHR